MKAIIFVISLLMCFQVCKANNQAKENESQTVDKTTETENTSVEEKTTEKIDYLAKIPFIIRGSHMMIKASINDSEQIYLLFDTGASHNVIDEDYAQEINLTVNDSTFVKTFSGKTAARHSISKGNTLNIGRYKLQNEEFTYHKGIVNMLKGKEKCVGAIGGTFLFRFIIKVDYANNHLYLFDPATFSYKGEGDVIPMKLQAMMPGIDVAFELSNNKIIKGRAAIDSGASFFAHIRTWANDEYDVLSYFDKKVSQQFRSATGVFFVEKVRVKSIMFGKQKIKGLPTLVQTSYSPKLIKEGEDYMAMIGGDLLKRYHVYFDYINKQIILEPNRFFNKPYIVELSGLKFTYSSPQKSELRILKVTPNSSGYKAGIKKDDLILAINGKKVVEYSPNVIRKMFFLEEGKNLKIDILRGNETVSCSILLEDII